MVTIFLFAFVLSSEKTPPLETVLKFSDIPKSLDLDLVTPTDVQVDARGYVYVVDAGLKAVVVWDEKGKYKSHFGKEGQGPGEFVFSAQVGGSQGYCSPLKNQIVIYDGAQRKVNIFDLDFQFVESENIPLAVGRTESFSVMKDGNFLALLSVYDFQNPHRKVYIYSPDGLVEDELMRVKDQTYFFRPKGGVTLNQFAPQVSVHYDRLRDHILIGNSSEPSFSIYKPSGEKIKTITMKLPAKPVTDADKTEVNENPRLKGQAFFRAALPDYKAPYDFVVPYGDNHFVAYTISPVEGHVMGYVVKENGEISNSFTFTCGDGGSFFSSRDRFFATRINEGEDLELVELRVKK